MNTEFMLLQGYSNLFATVCIETLVGSSNWFTQSLRSSPLAPTAFGQVEEFQQRARINWLLTFNSNSQEMLPHLIDNLGFEAGLRGFKFLCASSDSGSFLFEILRKAGYCIYGWERFWKIKSSLNIENVSSIDKFQWTATSSMDTHDLVRFQNKHLPPAVRSATPLADELLPEYVLKNDGVIQAYARVRRVGGKGLIQPVIAADVEDWNAALQSLLLSLRNSCSVWYFLQSTSHDRLDGILSEIAAPVTERLESMVKYFTIMEKNPAWLLNHSPEKSHPDPVAPFMNSTKTQDNL